MKNNIETKKKMVATVIALTDLTQLRATYGNMKAEEIHRNLGNVFVGKVDVPKKD